MKTYEQMMMEVMSMSDMNKIKGGTEEQRKIAQERQRRRESKNSGTTTSTPSTPKPTNTSSAIVKAEPKSLPSDKGGALVKKDKRRSEMGKWSQGIKNVKVKVDDPKTNKPPTVTPAKGNVSTPVPDKTHQPTGKRPEEEIAKKKKKKNKKKEPGMLSKFGSKFKDQMVNYNDQSVGDVGGKELSGPEVGRDKGSVG
jgi:hypothetical protein